MKNEFVADILAHMFKPIDENDHPSTSLTIKNFLNSINVFADKKNWPQFLNLVIVLVTLIPTVIFFSQYFTWKLFIFSVVFNAIFLNIFSTLYFHRYASHRAFKVKNKLGHFILKNLAPRLFNEESFALCHYVHHKLPDSTLDPHRATDGFLHCYLSDFTQMRTSRDLDEKSYNRVKKIIDHVDVRKNTYKEYQNWGSVLNPFSFIQGVLINWALWITAVYLIGGTPLLMATGTGCFFWCLAVRNFNYKSHGSGVDKRKEGRDFDNESISLNLFLPGTLCGEWHSNHHVYPESANAGFKASQLDLTFMTVKLLHSVGVVESYIDRSSEFKKRYLSDERNGGIARVAELK